MTTQEAYMKLVYLESPYMGEIVRNVAYARACMRDSLQRGESPYASHLLLTQIGILDDTVPDERELGIHAGFAWAERADLRVVYTDLGISRGMALGIEHAERIGQPVEVRRLGGEWEELRK